MGLINSKNGDIRDCGTIFELAELLSLDVKTLLFFAYKNKELYINYKIKKKSGGERKIAAPIEALKTTCRKLAASFNQVYEESAPTPVHGFVQGKSIITNAEAHIAKKFVLNIDLENFFGTINSGRVMGLLKSHPFNFNKQLASVITGIVTYDNCLPQGAPTSPVISNMICRKLDVELIKLAVLNNWVYSRYADDITISANVLTEKLVTETEEGFVPGSLIQKIIVDNGFSINKKKVRLASKNQGKWVTGIKVNERLNVSRSLIRQIRSLLFSLEKLKANGGNINSPEGEKRLAVVRGKISHVGNVKSKDNITYIKLYNRLCELGDRNHKRLPESPKEKYKENVLLIKTSVGFGSGFFIRENIIVTAAHLIGIEERTVEITTRKMRLPAEFKGANVLHVDRVKDLAILYTNSTIFSKSIFDVDFGNKGYDHNTEYVSVGYAAFRSNHTYWTDPSVVDQRIVQVSEDLDSNIDYLVNNPMWSGMSGGPIISNKTGLVVGYIVFGSPTLADGQNFRTHAFRSILNVPAEFRPLKEKSSGISTITF